MSLLASAHDRALSALSRVHSTYLALTDWAAHHSGSHDRGEDDEAGNYSTEMVVVIAAIVVLAVAVLAVIAKKVLDKADSIQF